MDSQENIFDMILTVNTISQSKQVIGGQIPLLLNAITISVSQFSLEMSFPFLEFVQWCVDNYSKSKRVLVNSLGSGVLCKINS